MIKPKKTLENIQSYRVEPYAQPWLMKLDSNENYLGPSPKIINRLKNLLPEQICHYPYYGELYEKIAQLNNVSVDNIAVTNGADESLESVLNTYLTDEDAVITVTPSFSMPKIYAGIIGAEYIEIPYETKWDFPENAFLSSITDKVKIILITTPNNPTGDTVNSEFVRKILDTYPDKMLVLDETYSSYADFTFAPLIKEYDNLTIVRSFSKDYALAGLRIGYVISDEKNISNITKVLSPYTVNNIAAVCAVEAINDTEHINGVKEEIKASKAFLSSVLTQFGAEAYNSYANFILTDFQTKNKAEEVYSLLKSNKIIVKKFSGTLETCLRITVPSLASAKKIEELLNATSNPGSDLIVFDMDGVLVDVSDSYRCAIIKTYEKFTGKKLSFSEIQDTKNLGGMNNDWDLTMYLVKESGFDVPYSKIVDEFQKIYWDEGKGVINDETLLIDPKTLESLCKTHTLAVFTGRPRIEAEYTLKKFDIAKYFSKVITMDDLPSDKQKPHTMGLSVLKKEFCASSDTSAITYLGDTIDDMKCARDFEVCGVGVLPPSDKSDGLKDLLCFYGAKYVINDVNEISEILSASKGL